jgi:hypothetical protein
VTRVSARWLALREPADAAAHATDLIDHLPAGPHVIHDLGCGTGAMGRWLAPRLAGPQHWVLHDRDADLLDAAHLPHPVTFETRRSDITQLAAGALAGATLITASALLDMLTEQQLVRLLDSCASAGCPVLLTLTVAGRAELTPADPLDRSVATAFNGHQRRAALGPDAIPAAVTELERHGMEVLTRPSPWQLGHEHAELMAEWFTGWVRAACEADAGLAAQAQDYTRRRLAQASAGQLAVTVDHTDVLAQKRGESA